MNPLNTVLERLENPRPYGKNWRANCPNEHKSQNTLIISEGDDGRALLYCHALCSLDEILGGLGLQKQDLFTRQCAVNMTPQQRREYRDKARQGGWKTALELLPLEINIVQIAAVQITQGKPLNLPDHRRLELAGKRIASAKEALCGR